MCLLNSQLRRLIKLSDMVCLVLNEIVFAPRVSVLCT